MKSLDKVLLTCIACCLAILSGCSGEVRLEYGYSETALAEQSPGGISVFREMIKARNLDTETLVALKPSMDERINTLVWTPDYFPKHTKPVLDRLDRWLRQGGKTLVYVGRDYSPHSDYWERLANDPNNGKNARERARIKVQAAGSVNQLDALRETHRDLLITPWFYWRATAGPFRKITRFQGEWSDDPSLSQCSISLRSSLVPYDATQHDLLTKELDWNTTIPTNGSKYTKIWTAQDEELLTLAKGILPGDLGESNTLLEAMDGSPVVSAISYRNSSSRVIVLSNSSAICNLSLLNASNRNLANKIIDQFADGTVGFVSMDKDPPIEQGTAQEQNKGFEMLTVWPFNVITIHAAVIAMVALVAAFPIFGRPKSIPKKAQVDFGEHVESLGYLLQATGGRQWAKDAISRYFRIVRRDIQSPWSQRESIDPETSIGDKVESNTNGNYE